MGGKNDAEFSINDTQISIRLHIVRGEERGDSPSCHGKDCRISSDTFKHYGLFVDMIVKDHYLPLRHAYCVDNEWGECPESDILEVSPFVSPRFQGAMVKYFDVLSLEELKKKADDLNNKYYTEQMNQLMDGFNIHYVEPNGDLSIIDRKFRIIFSSHCVVCMM
jgi:hypothetical protein